LFKVVVAVGKAAKIKYPKVSTFWCALRLATILKLAKTVTSTGLGIKRPTPSAFDY